MNRARMLLPPPETPLARFLVTTLAAISFKALDKMGYQCSIAEGFDEDKMLEFIDIVCEDNIDVDCIVASFWSIRGNSVTEPAWESIRLVFDERSQILKYDAGGFPRSYRYLQDILFARYTKYTFGRGFAMEALRRETVKGGKPKAEEGFIDFSLANAIPFLYGLDRLRQSLRLVYGDRVLHLLLADLGDRGLGLLEAVEKLYNPTPQLECVESVCEKGGRGKGKGSQHCLQVLRPDRSGALNLALPSQKLGTDLGLWVRLSLQLSLVELVLEGSIELVSRWPTIAIVSYTAGGKPFNDDTRNLSVTMLSADDVIASMQGLETSAEELGLTSLNLARGLRRVMECVSELSNRGERERSEAGALLSRALPLIDSILRGFVDRDLYYHVARMLSSIASRSDTPYSCRSAASML